MYTNTLTLRNVRKLMKRAKPLELSEGALQRLRWFQFALEHGGNVSLTCRHFGIARSTYLRWADRFDARDASSLEEESRRPLHVREPETDPRVIELIRAVREAEPLLGKDAISALLAERGVRVSASTVGRTIARYGFFFAETAAHERKRASGVRLPIPASAEASAGVSPFSPALPPEPLAS